MAEFIDVQKILFSDLDGNTITFINLITDEDNNSEFVINESIGTMTFEFEPSGTFRLLTGLY